MKKEGFTSRLRATVFGALTGNTGDVSGRTDADVRDMLMALGGPAKTKSGINLTAAASQLGVTRRTVERWVTDAGERGKPRGKTLANLVTKSRQSATTQAGRRRAVGRIRETGGPGGSAIGRYGTKVSISGVQGPAVAGKDYLRQRRVHLDLDPDAVQGMWGAYEQGGDKAFVGWLENHADQDYVGGWTFGSIDSLDLGQ